MSTLRALRPRGSLCCLEAPFNAVPEYAEHADSCSVQATVRYHCIHDVRIEHFHFVHSLTKSLAI
jgi:hypothetical protein